MSGHFFKKNMKDALKDFVKSRLLFKLALDAKEARETEDAVMLGQVVTQLRCRFGFGHYECFVFLHKYSGVSAEAFEGMKFRID